MKPLSVLAARVLAACSSAVPSVQPTATPLPSSPATRAPSVTASVSPSAAPSPTLAPLVEGPLPTEVAADLQEVLDAYIVEHGLAPSMSVAVIVPGVGAWYGASGFADLDHESAATPDTVYALGNMTRNFVAALILRLVEEGFLRLDDPAADHLGLVAGAKTNGATVRQLLGHRSGIDSFADHGENFEDRPWSPAEVLELVGNPRFAPGERYEYSPTDYLLLGLIAEVVTGGPLAELLHEYLLDRFDLSRTFYGAGEVAPEPVAHGYQSAGGQLIDTYDGSGKLPNANKVSAALGAGSMAGTAADTAHWLYLLFSGQVLRPESESVMLDFSASVEYGLGVMRFAMPGTGQVIGSHGNISGFESAAYMSRGSGVIVVLQTNCETLDVDGALKRLFEVAVGAAP